MFARTVMNSNIVVTTGVPELHEAEHIAELLERHAKEDFGNLCEEDVAANKESITASDDHKKDHPDPMPSMVMSSYDTTDGDVWVITEADRSVTTVLLPSEY